MVSDRIWLFTSRTGLNRTRCPGDSIAVVDSRVDCGKGSGISEGIAADTTTGRQLARKARYWTKRIVGKALLIFKEISDGLRYGAGIAIQVTVMPTRYMGNLKGVDNVAPLIQSLPEREQALLGTNEERWRNNRL